VKKVSIILTTYNGGDSLEKTIPSILNQEGVNESFEIELIAIDDCSTDNTVEILQRFDLIFHQNEKNSGGPNAGRNVGLAHATGDYICIADQDDIWKKHKLKVLLPYLAKVPIVSSGYTVMDTSTHHEIERVSKHPDGSIYYPANNTFLTKLTKNYSGQQTYLGSLIYDKSLKNIQFEETFGVVDFDWVLRLFHNRDSIEVCDSLYIRHVDGQNLSLNTEYRKKDFYYSLMFIESYQEEYPKAVRLANLKIHGSRARFYYLTNNMKMARFYLSKSNWSLKTAIYYLTTFVGSNLVKKYFKVFG